MPASPTRHPGSPAATSPLGTLSPSARSLWAKSGDETGWLCLPQHMLDSAGVATRLWDHWTSSALRESCTRACGLSTRDAGTLISWLAGTHDIGKACRKFQSQLDGSPEYAAFAQRVREAGLDPQPSTLEASSPMPHSVASQVILDRWLTARGLSKRVARSLAAVAGCHHGVPPSQHLEKTASAVLDSYDESWLQVWDELLAFITEYTQAGPALERLSRPVPVAGQMLATGLVIMSDWIASNAETFPMVVIADQEMRVEHGCAAVDLTAPWEPEPPDLSDLDVFLRHRFSWPEDASARPCQQVVTQACQEAEGPTLLILEAPTGEGKTEAALLAAEVLGSSGAPAGGVLLAAPTMSTSDSLFRRTREWAASASEDLGEVLSMFLGHSRSALNEDYQRLRTAQVYDETADHREDTGRGQVVASQWMSGRKKGVLSTVVVSTVDQVLFMALQAKHAMLRHLGLAGKVVVIDEVHAYDAYMNVYLTRAIEWLAEYGTSVVLLSATLPVQIKRTLMEAYGRGLHAQRPLGELSSAYPLVTALSRQGSRELAVPPRPADIKAAVSTIADDVPTLVRTVLESTEKEGGCVLVLCNTVTRAQDAYTALRTEMGEDVRLLHARFVAGDRVSLEKELVAEMGPRAHRGSGRPARRVVVATQVAEQSLDIDVDLLITDIAPMDLILQRLGRLHRHARPEGDRPEGLRRPRMILRGLVGAGPQTDAGTQLSSANDLFDSSSTAVYDEALLLATYATLLKGPLGGDVLTRPDDVPHLVQTTYSPTPPVPAAWEEVWQEAVVAQRQARTCSESRASTFVFPPAGDAKLLCNLFAAQDRDIADSARSEASGLAQVRDSDPTIEAVVIVDRPGGYTPLPWLVRGGVLRTLVDDQDPGWATAQVLARSTVRLPRSLCLRRTFDTTIDALEQATPIGWAANGLLRGLVALRLDSELTCEVSGRRLRYERELGLQETQEQRGT
ncbi:CRISPR-associated helicase Cas3' [Actinomyces wuliandei]|uniref:CRISPR-associated helicase Cas3' n=1 Tax=Actinomyces wuliandei TaxID=2057743 RepID=UPI00111AE9CE|nr:CRISPR-associated helicase Cas3' [Actinomyces wuliandei]